MAEFWLLLRSAESAHVPQYFFPCATNLSFKPPVAEAPPPVVVAETVVELPIGVETAVVVAVPGWHLVWATEISHIGNFEKYDHGLVVIVIYDYAGSARCTGRVPAITDTTLNFIMRWEPQRWKNAKGITHCPHTATAAVFRIRRSKRGIESAVLSMIDNDPDV